MILSTNKENEVFVLIKNFFDFRHSSVQVGQIFASNSNPKVVQNYIVLYSRSLTKPIENFLVYKRDQKIEKDLKMTKVSFGLMEQLYGSIRNLNSNQEQMHSSSFSVMESYAPHYASKEAEAKKEVNMAFGLNYGVRPDLNFYQMIPQIGFVTSKEINEYTISTLKIKFKKGIEY